jgi:hypothetical protein
MSKLQPAPEVSQSIDAHLSVRTGPAGRIGPAAGTGLGALLLLTGGCLSANVGMDGTTAVVLSSSSSGDSSEDEGSSGASGIMTTTEDPDHTSGDSTGDDSGTDGGTSGSGTVGTTGAPVDCGDGVLQLDAGEECDDGEANADIGACTSDCKLARCGDKLLQAGVEVCDDGTNDGSYNGCALDCKALGARCGDGELQAPEEQCDDATPTSGCLPESCVYAKSCKEIKDAFGDAATDGVYSIAPLGTKVQVVCDMDADGGGYTFLKVGRELPASAKDAEAACAKYGMRLLVPRSKAHLAAAVLVAQSDVLAPIGPGLKASLDYLKIFGIYPKVYGQSCAGKPLNHVTCTQWTAFGDVFWVTDQTPAEPYNTEPATKTCVQCSLAYTWNMNGTLKGYESVIGDNQAGEENELFMCEVPDMMPPK